MAFPSDKLPSIVPPWTEYKVPRNTSAEPVDPIDPVIQRPTLSCTDAVSPSLLDAFRYIPPPVGPTSYDFPKVALARSFGPNIIITHRANDHFTLCRNPHHRVFPSETHLTRNSLIPDCSEAVVSGNRELLFIIGDMSRRLQEYIKLTTSGRFYTVTYQECVTGITVQAIGNCKQKKFISLNFFSKTGSKDIPLGYVIMQSEDMDKVDEIYAHM